jgi:membrane protease YdiL (CAAX protease family)
VVDPTPATGSDPDAWSGAAYLGAPATVQEAVTEGVPLRVPRWGLADVVILVLGTLLVPVVILSLALGAGVSKTGGAFLLLAATSPWIVFAGWPLVTTHLQGNGVRIDLGYVFRRTDIGWGVAGGVACYVLATPVGWLTAKVFGDFDSAAGVAAQDARAPRWVLVLYAVIVAVGAPLAEELAFRGLVFGAVAKYASGRGESLRAILVWAGFWATVLFAGIHLEPVRIPVLLVIGAVLSYLRARTGRVGAGVIAHALNNLPGALGIAFLGM